MEDYWDYLNLPDSDISGLFNLFGNVNNLTSVDENVPFSPNNVGQLPPTTVTTESNTLTSADERVHEHVPNYAKVGIQLFILIIGAALNFGFVFLILGKSKNRNSISNMYLLQISLAQLFIVFTFPFQVSEEFMNEWIFSSGFCRMNEVFYHLGIYGTMLLLMVVCVDKLFEICFSATKLSRMIRNKFSMCVISASVWIIALIVCSPVMLYSGKGGHNPNCKCIYQIPDYLKTPEERCRSLGITNEEILKVCEENLPPPSSNGPVCHNFDVKNIEDFINHESPSYTFDHAPNMPIFAPVPTIDTSQNLPNFPPMPPSDEDYYYEGIVDSFNAYGFGFGGNSVSSIHGGDYQFDANQDFSDLFQDYINHNNNPTLQPPPEVTTTAVSSFTAANTPSFNLRDTSLCHFRNHGAAWHAVLIFNFVVMFVLPVSISICVLIYLFLKTGTIQKHWRKIRNDDSDVVLSSNPSKTMFKEGLILATFVVCYFPYHLILVMKIQGLKVPEENSSSWCDNITNFTVYIHYFFALFYPLIGLLWRKKDDMNNSDLELSDRQSSSLPGMENPHVES